MISDPAYPRAKSIKTTRNPWAALKERPFPYLHELFPTERDRFVLLDAYLRDCLEEWCASGGQLSARAHAARWLRLHHYQALSAPGW
jgi:hypothetical protein